MMRMSDKLESLLCEGMDDADGDAAEGVYRNLALRYAAQLEECCQLLYGEDVAAELGIQSDGVSVERWVSATAACPPHRAHLAPPGPLGGCREGCAPLAAERSRLPTLGSQSCGGQFLVDVIGRWVFGPSFWIKEHLWRLPDGPSRWEAYRGYHNQLRGTELLLPASYMSVDPWLLSLGCFRGSSAASGRESSMIRYCLELMQVGGHPRARHRLVCSSRRKLTAFSPPPPHHDALAIRPTSARHLTTTASASLPVRAEPRAPPRGHRA